MARLIAIAVQRLGITEVRFTRGEPLLRRGLAGLIAAAAALRPRPEISLTTNGIGLARLAGPLRNAGLDRINVSLDTLSPQTLVTLARRDRLANVLPGLSAAAAAGLAPVKVNAVLMRGVNDHEAAPLLRLCLDRGYQLRFIEQMPLDAQHGWRRTSMITASEILAALSARFSLTPADPAGRGSAPAETFLVDNGPHTLGVIGSVTRPFCAACDRVRLTPTARSATTCSPGTRATCAPRCGPEPTTTSWPPSGAARSPPSCPGTASTITASCSPPGRCQPSAADRAAIRAARRAGFTGLSAAAVVLLVRSRQDSGFPALAARHSGGDANRDAGPVGGPAPAGPAGRSMRSPRARSAAPSPSAASGGRRRGQFSAVHRYWAAMAMARVPRMRRIRVSGSRDWIRAPV